LPAFSRLHFFSDGVHEVTRPDGSMLTFQEFMDILSRAPRDRCAVPGTIAAIREIRGPQGFEDDVSIVEVTV
jgi:serine phosphatase RsbU (regulator of sigma subunit)